MADSPTQSPTQRIPVENIRSFSRVRGKHPWTVAPNAHWPVFIAYLVWLVAAWLMLVLRGEMPTGWQWAEGLVFVFAAATVLVGMARRLPLQNVVACALVVVSVSAMVTAIGARTGMPFGRFDFTEVMGPRLLDLMIWPVPFIWITLLLASRGVAKVLLRPFRREKQYGVLVIVVTAVLVVLLDMTLDPYLSQGRRWWVWRALTSGEQWYGAPWSNSVAWLVMAALTLGFATPWLVLKRPLPGVTGYHPVAVWCSLALYLATGNAMRQLWGAAALGGVAGIVIGIAGWRLGTPPLPRAVPPPGRGIAEAPAPEASTPEE